MELEDSDEPGQIRTLRRDGTLRVVVTNDSTRDATAVLRAAIVSRVMQRSSEVSRVFVPAAEPVTEALDARALDLPSGTFDFSGGLTVDAALEFDDGATSNSVLLNLYFHPTGDGWQIYDLTALDGVLRRGRADRGRAGKACGRE